MHELFGSQVTLTTYECIQYQQNGLSTHSVKAQDSVNRAIARPVFVLTLQLYTLCFEFILSLRP